MTDPDSLSGLAQTFYIMQCIQQHLSKRDIIDKFASPGIERLVEEWFNLLLVKRWIQKAESHSQSEYILTKEGKAALEHFSKSGKSE